MTTPSPKLLVATLLGVAVYLGLAILGWGGFSAYFANPARTTLMVVMLTLTIAALFSKGNISPGEREDRKNRWVLWAFTLIGLASAYFPALTDRLGILVIGGDALRWFGVALAAAGGVLRLWPVFVLGKRFSGLVAIQPGHTLVTDGIYRKIRNPSYLGLLISSLGWALTFRSIVGIALTALMLIPLVARMNAEERLLAEQFGPDYTTYRHRTFRLIPGLY